MKKVFLIFVITIAFVPFVNAKDEPLWELGAGIATYRTPH